jgi:hypothetical protein
MGHTQYAGNGTKRSGSPLPLAVSEGRWGYPKPLRQGDLRCDEGKSDFDHGEVMDGMFYIIDKLALKGSGEPVFVIMVQGIVDDKIQILAGFFCRELRHNGLDYAGRIRGVFFDADISLAGIIINHAIRRLLEQALKKLHQVTGMLAYA